MELTLATTIAEDIVRRLVQETDKIMIAGSIRRKKAEVGDIELVCLPKVVEVVQSNLFGSSDKKEFARSPKFIEQVKGLGEIEKGKPESGRYVQIVLPEGIVLDLFIPEVEDFWRQAVIRTGSAEFVTKYIAGGWKRKMWCGSDKGLRKMKDCQESKDPATGKSKWKCVNPNAEKPPNFENEEHFFHWLGYKWVEPVNRYIT